MYSIYIFDFSVIERIGILWWGLDTDRTKNPPCGGSGFMIHYYFNFGTYVSKKMRKNRDYERKNIKSGDKMDFYCEWWELW